MTQPRLIEPGSIYLVTRRTILRHHLLAPEPRMNRIFKFVLAVAAERTGIQVHCAVLMSTHEHLVVSDPNGRLPEFLQYLHRHVALATKSLRLWEGPVWDHEPTSVVELRTAQAVVEKIAYAIANPVAAGLVRHAKDWIGVTTRPSELGQAVWKVERPAEYFGAETWPEEAELRLEMPRTVRELSLTDVGFRELVEREVENLQDAACEDMRREGRAFLGADRCAKLSPFRRSQTPEPVRSRNPTFAVGRANADALSAAAARIRAFRIAYRQTFESWRGGDRTVIFPAGTWLMRYRHAVSVEEPARPA